MSFKKTLFNPALSSFTLIARPTPRPGMSQTPQYAGSPPSPRSLEQQDLDDADIDRFRGEKTILWMIICWRP